MDREELLLTPEEIEEIGRDYHGDGRYTVLYGTVRDRAIAKAQLDKILSLGYARLDDARDCLDCARSAIFDATYHDDGLDGKAGETIMEWITEILGDKDTWLSSIESVVDNNSLPSDKVFEFRKRKGQKYV